MISSVCAIIEFGFFIQLSWQNGTKNIFLTFNREPIFLKFIPRASFEDIEMTRGLPVLMCPFAAIRTGVSVMPLFSFARVLPVHGAMIRISNILLGPNFYASLIVLIALFPVVSSTNFTKSDAFPNLVSVL